MVEAGAHLDQEGRSSSQPLTNFQQPSSDNWHPPHAQQPSGTSSEEGSGSSLSWQPYPAPPQHQNGPSPYLSAPPLQHMAPQHPLPPPIHPPPPTQAGYSGVPPHPMAPMLHHHHHPWQGHHHMPPPPRIGATFPPTHGIPHAYLVGGCYPPPPPPQGYYPPPPMAYPMYLVAAPPPLTEQQHPALAPPQKQERPANSSSSSKYPGKHVRPLREVMVATGHPPLHVMNGYQHPPPLRPLPPSELCVPTLLSPLRNKRPRPVVGQPWAVLHDLQQQHAHPVPEAKVAWYSQMNREWHAVLERQNQQEETLDFDRLHVILTCLMDRDPCNYTNLGLALTSLQKLTATEHQRAQITLDEEAIKIYQAMIKLVEWPVASRVLGAANITNVFSVLVALLEDDRLRATATADLLSKLSTVSASIWILWNKDETIVALARRALVAINPHYDSEDDEEETEDSTDNDHCSRTESPVAGVQDTLPASVSVDNSVEWTADCGSRDGGASTESPESSKVPLPWTTTNQVQHDTKHRSARAWFDREGDTKLVKEVKPCGYSPQTERGCRRTPAGSSSVVSTTANRELDLQERSGKRQCVRNEPKEASYLQ